ncbi:hypothetical protein ACFVY0_46125 [Streptomyces sp. NPDC058286]|uniref:hypothetical protein n=1 Tax=Streptomyces sp. NPDC058286 TaxID=3346422 RepID=UPI0036E55ED6
MSYLNYRYSTNSGVAIDAGTRLVVVVGTPFLAPATLTRAEFDAKDIVGVAIAAGCYPDSRLVRPHRWCNGGVA